jgi:succinate dehydrogenase / fumarate reductase flavoprotein subunit
MSAQWRRRQLVCQLQTGSGNSASNGIAITEQPIAPIRSDLLALFERSELEKYLTEEELPAAGTDSDGGRP